MERRSLPRYAALGLLIAGAVSAQPVAGITPDLDVLRYDATVEPNLSGKTVKGRVAIDFVLTSPISERVQFDIGELTVDSVTEGGALADFSQDSKRLNVQLGRPGRSGERRRVEIEYHGAPRYGLVFAPEKSEVYTIFSTSQWMPCVDAPGDRATLRLTLVLPRGLEVIANGRPVRDHQMAGNLVAHEWTLDRSVPTYTMGFAAGRFHLAEDRHGKTRLRFLSADLPATDLRRVFADTKDMLDFFEARSGVRYPDTAYTQVLVEDTIGQELTGFSLMSEEYGQAVLADPSRVGLIAHEFAHQWWGNAVTCEDWTHFWLNEGLATFMAAAYRERRLGRDAYLRDVEGWRERYERVKAAGRDRSLVFPDWNHPTSDDRALVYQKGALALHELRDDVGDRAFWAGLRLYTRGHFGKSVRTADFQMAMEMAAHRNLTAFFNEWVYLISTTP